MGAHQHDLRIPDESKAVSAPKRNKIDPDFGQDKLFEAVLQAGHQLHFQGGPFWPPGCDAVPAMR